MRSSRETNETLALVEIEETAADPKRLLADAFATLFGDHITFQGQRRLLVGPWTALFILSKVSASSERARLNFLEDQISRLRPVLMTANSELSQVFLRSYSDEADLEEALCEEIRRWSSRSIAMTQVKKPEPPIGYWLKQADNLLTEQINSAQAANGVSRFEWQVLNMLSELGRASRERIFESMRTFLDTSGFDEIITRLTGRGWVERSEVSKGGTEELQLTEEGRRRHEVILATQKEVRRRAMQGISEEEYATVVRVLRRLVSNLEGNGDSAGRQDTNAA